MVVIFDIATAHIGKHNKILLSVEPNQQDFNERQLEHMQHKEVNNII